MAGMGLRFQLYYLVEASATTIKKYDQCELPKFTTSMKSGQAECHARTRAQSSVFRRRRRSRIVIALCPAAIDGGKESTRSTEAMRIFRHDRRHKHWRVSKTREGSTDVIELGLIEPQPDRNHARKAAHVCR